MIQKRAPITLIGIRMKLSQSDCNCLVSLTEAVIAQPRNAPVFVLDVASVVRDSNPELYQELTRLQKTVNDLPDYARAAAVRYWIHTIRKVDA